MPLNERLVEALDNVQKLKRQSDDAYDAWTAAAHRAAPEHGQLGQRWMEVQEALAAAYRYANKLQNLPDRSDLSVKRGGDGQWLGYQTIHGISHQVISAPTEEEAWASLLGSTIPPN